MTLLRSIVMAFSMFSIIPTPRIEWNERSMRYSLAAFPLVGVVIGLVLWGWISLCGWLELGTPVMAIGIVITPLLVSGGIHMDGFADAVDGIASRTEPERRREIMKDSRVGSFGAMGIATYLLVQFAFAVSIEIRPDTLACICMAPVIGRVLSGIASIVFPGATSTGLLGTFRESTDKRPALVALLIMLVALLVGLGFASSWMAAVLFIVIAAVMSAIMLRIAVHGFGGMTGDLAGYYLQVLELLFLVAAFVVGRFS